MARLAKLAGLPDRLCASTVSLAPRFACSVARNLSRPLLIQKLQDAVCCRDGPQCRYRSEEMSPPHLIGIDHDRNNRAGDGNSGPGNQSLASPVSAPKADPGVQ